MRWIHTWKGTLFGPTRKLILPPVTMQMALEDAVPSKTSWTRKEKAPHDFMRV